MGSPTTRVCFLKSLNGTLPLHYFIQYTHREMITFCRRKSRGGMHSQASYWFSIGFKQMVCTVATCNWFLRCFGFTKPEAFFPLNITTGSLIAQSFFYLY